MSLVSCRRALETRLVKEPEERAKAVRDEMRNEVVKRDEKSTWKGPCAQKQRHCSAACDHGLLAVT